MDDVMLSIKFSEEWDKLKAPNRIVGETFGTARGYTPQKHAYYKSIIGKEMTINCNGEILGIAMLERIEFLWPMVQDIKFWKEDTYSYYTMEDIKAFFKKFYKTENPFCIHLRLRWTTCSTDSKT